MPLNREELGKLRETELHRLLKRLFEAMHHREVRITHGNSEAGRDLVMWRLNRSGRRVEIAVVAKVGPIKGSAAPGKGTAQEVDFQIRSCFGEGHLAGSSLAKKRVQEVLVVTSGHFTEDARKALRRTASKKRRKRVRLWDGDRLWKEIQSHLGPAALHDNLRSLLAEASSVDDNYEFLLAGPALRGKAHFGFVENDQARLFIAEKYPGASQEVPFTIRVRGRVPPDFQDRLYSLGVGGEAFSIPGEGIEIEYPPLLQAMFQGHSLRDLRFGPVQTEHQPPAQVPQELALRLDVRKGSTRLAVWGPTVLRPIHQDADTVVWSNRHEGRGLAIKFELHRSQPPTMTMGVTAEIPCTSIAVGELARALDFCHALSAGDKLVIFNLAEEISVEEDLRQAAFPEPEGPLDSLVRCLQAIQSRYGHEFILSDSGVSSRDYHQIRELGYLLTEGSVAYENLQTIHTLDTCEALAALVEGSPGLLLTGRRVYQFLDFETSETVEFEISQPRIDREALPDGRFNVILSGSRQVVRLRDACPPGTDGSDAPGASELDAGRRSPE